MDEKTQNLILTTLKKAQRRITSLGCRESEFFETYERIRTLSDWPKEVSKLAERFEKAGDHIEDGLVKASNYLKAVAYYHAAQLGIHEDTEEKKQIFYSCARAYNKAAKYFWAPVERVEYPYAGVMLSAYFRKVPGVKKAPCIIMVKGLDSSGEAEGHVMSDYYLQRGFFTLDIDCPGQYDARFKGLPMAPDFERPVAAALDYLKTRSDVDLDRIAISGLSFGGFIAPRAASLEPRIKACVSIGGVYSLDEIQFPIHYFLHLLNDLQVTAAQYPQKSKEYTLDGVIEKMTCPLLVVNGEKDSVSPASSSKKIYEKARCKKDLYLYEGLEHCAWPERKTVMYDVADWVRNNLPG